MRSHGLDVVCLRPVAVVFEGELDAYLSTVVPGTRSLYDYTAQDVAAAVALASTVSWSGFHVVGLCADDSAHPDPTLEWYPQLFGSLPDDVCQERFTAEPRAAVFANDLARHVLGWRPTSRFTPVGPVTADAGTGDRH